MKKILIAFVVVGLLCLTTAGILFWMNKDNLMNMFQKNSIIDINNVADPLATETPNTTASPDPTSTETEGNTPASDYILICPSGWVENTTSVSKSCANPAMNSVGISSSIMLTVADLGIPFNGLTECNSLAAMQAEEVSSTNDGAVTKVASSKYSTKPYLSCAIEFSSEIGSLKMVTYQKYIQKSGDDKMFILQGMYGSNDAADMMLVKSTIDSLIVK